jgi:prolyl-tRNA synthetase
MAGRVQEMLGEIHRELFDRAAAHLADNTRSFDDRDELIEYLKAGRGFAVTAWCGSPQCEAAVKAETSATLRCLALEPEDPGAPCAVCGRPGVETATWGQAY